MTKHGAKLLILCCIITCAVQIQYGFAVRKENQIYLKLMPSKRMKLNHREVTALLSDIRRRVHQVVTEIFDASETWNPAGQRWPSEMLLRHIARLRSSMPRSAEQDVTRNPVRYYTKAFIGIVDPACSELISGVLMQLRTSQTGTPLRFMQQPSIGLPVKANEPQDGSRTKLSTPEESFDTVKDPFALELKRLSEEKKQIQNILNNLPAPFTAKTTPPVELEQDTLNERVSHEKDMAALASTTSVQQRAEKTTSAANLSSQDAEALTANSNTASPDVAKGARAFQPEPLTDGPLDAWIFRTSRNSEKRC